MRFSAAVRAWRTDSIWSRRYVTTVSEGETSIFAAIFLKETFCAR